MSSGNLKLSRGDKSIRFYQRGNYCFMLCDFLPTKFGLVNSLECEGFEIKRTVSYPAVEMGVIIAEENAITLLEFITENNLLDGTTMDNN